jgi:serine/threonine protein kinase/Tol biopolymer transport system component
MPLAPGTRLGPYEILAAIGAGGMGEVYGARDTRLNREVAIKVSAQRFSDRFEREAHSIAALNHPNICTLYDVGPNYLVMELVEGPTLADRIKEGPVSLGEALVIARQVADALEAAHEKGVVHRDLKPGNIMIRPDGTVKVLDFGLAKMTEPIVPEGSPEESPTLTLAQVTRAGVILGTAAYMSPEQARGKNVDKRADIWAFGVVLYEMLTGQPAFRGETTTDVLAAVVKEEPDLTRAPVKVRRLLRTCLQKDPKQRLQAIGDWRLLVEDAPVAVERRYARAIALAAGICALVGTATFMAGRWTSWTPSPSFPRVTFRRGFVDSGRFANGGRTIVYSASWDGNPYRLYSTQAESPESRDLGITNGHLLAVSPSNEMAFALTPDLSFVAGTLARGPISGGSREITENISWADWTSDGARLAVVRAKAGFQQLEFPIGNVLYQTTGAILSPRISPKGDLIAFFDQPAQIAAAAYVATVDTKGNKKTLTGLWLGTNAGIGWSPFSDEIVFAAAAFSVTTSLYAVNRSGHQRLIAHLPGYFAVLDVAPDGRVLMSHSVVSTALFYSPGGDSKETDLYWHDASDIRDISRDGKALLFSEGGDATSSGEDYVSYLRRTDGSPAVRLGPGYPFEFSPDGKWAMVMGSLRAPSQLVLLPTGTGEARPLTQDAIHHQGAGWTPDGKRIVFVGNEPGHRIRYYVQSVDGGPPRAITPENVAFNTSDPVVISPDGRFVAVSGLDGKVGLQPLDGGARRAVPKLAEGLTPLRWCAGDQILVHHFGDLPVKIFRVDVNTGDQTPWKEVAPANRTGLAGAFDVRVDADCRSSAYSASYQPSELWIADGLR